MSYVVTDECKDCMFTYCVSVCPVDCFYDGRESDKMIFINPHECVNCGSCVKECPTSAIFPEAELPKDKIQWRQINAEKTLSGQLEIATRQKPLIGY